MAVVTPPPAARPRRDRHPHPAAADAAAQLARPDVELVTWHRPLPPDLDAPLVDWARRGPAELDLLVAGPRFALEGLARGLAEPARAWLARDAAVLLLWLARLGDARHLRVWFGAVHTDQCRKFHVDFVRYRMITTYTGPGTEWVPAAAVARDALAHPADCPCDANRDIVRDPSAVRHAVAGDVVVMKGGLHPDGRGAVHRSPPIAGTGRVRVVLIASTVDG